MAARHGRVPIEDHAVVGDGRSAALITRDGSVDWLCWPRFESEPVFGSLLDAERGGSFVVRALGGRGPVREYVPETNVLRTRWTASFGNVVVTDSIPVATDGDHDRTLIPEHELLRVVECTAGEARVHVVFDPRPGFAPPDRLRVEGSSVRAERGAELWLLRGTDGFTPRREGGVEAVLRLRAGERRALSLLYAASGPAVLAPLGEAALRRTRATIDWWRAWASRVRYHGPHRDEVVRSALVLKLMCYGPSGAVVAAPTTSLPERIGGDLNWDYRFCWLRDAAFTVRALFGLGFPEEADAFVSWMLHATRLTLPEVRVLYDVFGRAPRNERERPSLAGYAGSRPVRFGNAARDQFQLDVYGEVVEAVAQSCREGSHPDPETARLLLSLGTFVCRSWPLPDDGIWESRGPRRHHVHSRAMAWVALDRLLELHDAGHVPLDDESLARFRENREAIAREIRTRGWSEAWQTYVRAYDDDRVDASLLLLSWYGFEPPTSERMRGTFVAVDRALGAGSGLLYRNLDQREGAFGICGFWAVDHLARGGGSLEQARERFQALCEHANDVGLFAEEIDPRTGSALGNFPQAFTHIGLVNAALSIQDREAREARGAGHRPSRPGARIEVGRGDAR